MTWLVDQQMELRQRRGPDIAPPSNWQGVSAAVQMQWQDVNVAFQRQRQVAQERDTRALTAAERLGEAGLQPLIAEFNQRAEANGLTERIIAPGTKPQDILARIGSNGSQSILELARNAAAENPDAWADLDLTDEGIEATVTERRKRELELNNEILALSPNPVRNSILGGVIGAVADPVNLALAPFGVGAGGVLRTAAREAWLGIAAEGLQFPARQRVAEELGKEAPDLLESLALGAIGGAVIGVGVEVVPRVVRGLYYAGQARAQRVLENLRPDVEEEVIGAGETALADGQNPLDAVVEVLQRNTPAFDDPTTFDFPAREPLIPRSVTAETPEPTPMAPEPITTQTLPPREGEAPQTDNELAAMAETALNDADAMRQGAVGTRRFPFLQALKKAGVRINPDSPEGQELKAMGINARTMPGLFSRKAAGERTALDTLVASEWDETFPGLWEATRTPRDTSGSGGLYLDRDGVFDVIRREQAGDLNWIRAVEDAGRLERDAELTLRTGRTTEVEDFTSGARAENGFFMEPPNPFDGGADEFTSRLEDARRGIGEFAFRNGIRDLLPQDMEEIARELAEYGGDGKFLIERAISREIDEIKRAVEAPDVTARATGGENLGGELAPEGRAPDGAAPGTAGSGAVEPQGAARQLAIPGTERTQTGDAQRLEAEAAAKRLQSKMRRLDTVRVEDDVDSLFATKQLDIFDDVTSPQADAFMDANLVAMRDLLDSEGDISVGAVAADDGTALNTLSDVLNEIEEMDRLAAEFAKCRKGGAA